MSEQDSILLLRRIEQAIYSLEKRLLGTQTPVSHAPGEPPVVQFPSVMGVEVIGGTVNAQIEDQPIQVVIEDQPIQVSPSDEWSISVEFPDEPLQVSQSGSWSVGISNQPIQVDIENQPISVEQSGSWSVGISNQPIQVSQSGAWSVGINNQPVQVSQSGTWSVTVANSPVTVGYDTVDYAQINATAAGDTQIVPAVSGKRILVIAYAVVASGTVNIIFRSGTNNITGSMRMAASTVITHAYDGGLFRTNANQALNINLSAAATVGGYVVYRVVD